MECKDLIIPLLDVNDTKVTIGDIRFKNLEYIHEGEVLYSVETAKAVEEYVPDYSGYVVLYVEDCDEVKVGESAGVIFKDIEDAKKKVAELEAKKEKKVVVNASKKAIAYAESIGFNLSLIKKDGIIKTEDIDKYIESHK